MKRNNITDVYESVANKGKQGLFAVYDFDIGDVIGVVNCHGAEVSCAYTTEAGETKYFYDREITCECVLPENEEEKKKYLESKKWVIDEPSVHPPTSIYSIPETAYIEENGIFNGQFAQDGARLAIDRETIEPDSELEVVIDMHNTHVMRVIGDSSYGMIILVLVASRPIRRGSEIFASRKFHISYPLKQVICQEYVGRVREHNHHLSIILKAVDEVNVADEEQIQTLMKGGLVAGFAENAWNKLFYKLFNDRMGAEAMCDPKQLNFVVRAVMTTPEMDKKWTGLMMAKVRELKSSL